MGSVEAFFLGLLISWMPCFVILGWLMWRAPLVESVDGL